MGEKRLEKSQILQCYVYYNMHTEKKAYAVRCSDRKYYH